MDFRDLIIELMGIEHYCSVYEARETGFKSYFANYIAHFFYLIEGTQNTMDKYTLNHWSDELGLILKKVEESLNKFPDRNKLERFYDDLLWAVKEATSDLLKKYNYNNIREIKSDQIRDMIQRAGKGELLIEELGIKVEKLAKNKVRLIKIIENKV